jgi:hypothetical protein
MKKQDFINNLKKDCEKVESPPSVGSSFSLWVIASILIILGILIGLLNHPIINKNLFSINSILILLTSVTSAYSAFQTSKPTEKSWKYSFYLLPLSIWVVAVAFNMMKNPPLLKTMWIGSSCSLTLIALFVGPALLSYSIVRKGASTQPGLTGLLISISATFFSLWGLSIACPINFTAHILLWHIAPSFILSACGVYLGLRLKKWDRN